MSLKNKGCFIITLAAAAFAAAAVSAAAPAEVSIATSSVLPTYVALSPSINDFVRFADGGADANWYVGYNNAWIVKLPPAPLGEFARAFLGAKVGRAKTHPNEDRPWIREVIAGKVYMGISQNPSFTSEQSFFLSATEDLPLEADPQAHIDGVGAGEWVWTEVPLALVSFSRPNYLSIWSPTEYFVRAASAPILAAAPVDDASAKEVRAWNNHSISGVPPRNPVTALETPLATISPALAIKLVPAGETAIEVGAFTSTRAGRRHILAFSAAGENIAEAWVESSRDRLDWDRLTRIQRRQPFLFSVPVEKYPSAGSSLRGAARDILGNVGYSEPFAIPYAAP